MPSQPKQRKMAIVGSRSVGERLQPQFLKQNDNYWKRTALGKSSLTVQFVDGHFVESYYPTIENTFNKVIQYRGQEFATEIVDTAGQVSKRSEARVPIPKPACCSNGRPPDLNLVWGLGRIQYSQF